MNIQITSKLRSYLNVAVILALLPIFALTANSKSEAVPPIVITTQAELEAIGGSPESLTANYVLGNDIVLDNNFPTSDYYIGLYDQLHNVYGEFAGTFDGASHTISGLKVPLFFSVGDGVQHASVAHLNLSTSEEGISGISILAEQLKELSTMEDISVSGKLIQGESNPVGGIVGRASQNTSILNSSSIVTIILASDSGDDIGGLAGSTQGEIINSSAKIDFYGNAASGNIGGLVGWASVGSSISGSASSGTILGGGSAEGTYFGGLVGLAQGAAISNSYSSVSITTEQDSLAGGLIGYAESFQGTQITVSHSYASGNIRSLGYQTGGLIGFISGGLVTNCQATGEVAGIWNVGGLVGYAAYTDVNNSAASGAVSGAKYVGGLIGAFGSTALALTSVQNSHAYGSVTLVYFPLPGIGSIGLLIGNLEVNASLSGVSATGAMHIQVTDPAPVNVGGLVGKNDGNTSDAGVINLGPAIGIELLNGQQSTLWWGQNSSLNFGEPYLLGLANSGFYAGQLSDQSSQSTQTVASPALVEKVKQPSYFLLVMQPRIERDLSGVTCLAGTYIFIREGAQREKPRLSSQRMVVNFEREPIAEFNTMETSTVFSSSLFQRSGTYSCSVKITQEGVSEEYSSLKPELVRELRKNRKASDHFFFQEYLTKRRKASSLLVAAKPGYLAQYTSLMQQASTQYKQELDKSASEIIKKLANEGISISVP